MLRNTVSLWINSQYIDRLHILTNKMYMVKGTKSLFINLNKSPYRAHCFQCIPVKWAVCIWKKLTLPANLQKSLCNSFFLWKAESSAAMNKTLFKPALHHIVLLSTLFSRFSGNRGKKQKWGGGIWEILFWLLLVSLFPLELCSWSCGVIL